MPATIDPTGVRFRAFASGDEAAVRAFLGADAFERFAWLLANPCGRRVLLGFFEERLVALRTGVPRTVRTGGEDVTFTRSLAGRPGGEDPALRPLFERAFVAEFAGAPPEGDPVLFGLPDGAAWKIGREELDYDMVRTVLRLERPVPEGTGAQDGPAGGVEVEESASFPAAVDGLFEACSAGLGAVGVRDAARLAWRYAERPDRAFAVGLARSGGELAGYAVLHVDSMPDDLRGVLGPGGSGSSGGAAAVLCDWLVRPGHEGAANALRAWADARAAAAGCERVVALFPDTSEPWLAFQRAGFRVHRTGLYLVAKTKLKRFSMRWLYKHWTTTAGDVDLV